MKRRPKASKKNRRNRRNRVAKFLERVHLDAAGIDIGSASHWVAVPEDRDDQPVREFKSFTPDLHALVDWLDVCGIDTVAMESTGVYWIPLFEILQERDFEVLLVNARHVKGVPGRKSDVVDCQWIQQLHTFGLLRGSFRPDAEITAIRTLVRHRSTLVQEAAAHIQRMHKSMTLMNLQLHNVLTDVTGVTGMAILRDIVAGHTDPSLLARHRDHRCKATTDEFVASLTGHYRAELVFALGQSIELFDVYQDKIRACDEQIEALIRDLVAQCPTPEGELTARPKSKRPRKNEPLFDIRSPLFVLSGGVDITEVPGIGPHRYRLMGAGSRNGTELFYREESRMMVVLLATGATFNVSARSVLFDAGPLIWRSDRYAYGYPVYDVSPDDQRFLMARLSGPSNEAAVELIVVENFFEELKERVPN